MISIQVNERFLDIEPQANVVTLLNKLSSPTDGIAVAINTEVIPRNQWETVELKNNDHILIIEATQGG